jgi:hypothetical protein
VVRCRLGQIHHGREHVLSVDHRVHQPDDARFVSDYALFVPDQKPPDAMTPPDLLRSDTVV